MLPTLLNKLLNLIKQLNSVEFFKFLFILVRDPEAMYISMSVTVNYSCLYDSKRAVLPTRFFVTCTCQPTTANLFLNSMSLV